jgi:hypothetical protein
MYMETKNALIVGIISGLLIALVLVISGFIPWLGALLNLLVVVLSLFCLLIGGAYVSYLDKKKNPNLDTMSGAMSGALFGLIFGIFALIGGLVAFILRLVLGTVLTGFSGIAELGITGLGTAACAIGAFILSVILGAIGGAIGAMIFKAPPSSGQSVPCAKCGFQGISGAAFCKKCGSALG